MAGKAGNPTSQQVNDAQHLDNMTSLQQPSAAEQSPITQHGEVKGDSPVTNAPTPTPDSPSLFNDPKNPNNKVVEVDPELTGDEAEETSSEANSAQLGGRGSEELGGFKAPNLNPNLTVQASGEVGEGDAAADAAPTGNNSGGNASNNQGSTGGGSGMPRVGKARAEAPAASQPNSAPPENSSSNAAEAQGRPTEAPASSTAQSILNSVTPQAHFIPDKSPAQVNRIASVDSQSISVAEGDTPLALNTSGKITVVDADAGQSFVQPQSNTRGAYGDFSIDANGNWTFTASSAYNQLAAAQQLSESFTVTSLDGTGTGIVTVTITGANDAAIIDGVTTAELTETDSAQTVSGLLTATDVDGTDNAFNALSSTAGSHGYGNFTMTTGGAWTYTMTAAQDQFVDGQTYTDSVTVEAADGTEQVITVTITGANDAAIIDGVTTAELTETDSAQTVSGLLTATDVDGTDNAFNALSSTAGSHGYGNFTMTTGGAWTYTMTAAQDQFVDGQTYTDSVTVEAADGTEQVITVTITGANDAAIIDGVTTAELTETDSAQTVSGLLTATDVDGTDNAFNALSSTAGSHGYGNFTMTTGGAWTYTMTAAQDQFVDGQTYTDSVTVEAADGTEQVITVTITGANDAAIIDGVTTAELTETDSAQTVSGLLTATDVDGTDNAFNALSSTAGSHGYGNFTMTTGGAWTYTMTAAQDQFVDGQTYTDSVTVEAADGTEQVITVTITGANDAAIIDGVTTAELTETDSAQTVSGLLTATDVDGTDNAFNALSSTAGSHGYGNFTMTTGGAWTYTMTAAQDQFVDGQTYTDSVTVEAADGTEQVITVTITGANDAAIIDGVTTAELTETDSAQTVSGLLTATDVDGTDNAFNALSSTAGSHGYGNFTMTTGGAWTYTMTAAQDQFVDGQTYTDSVTVEAADGTEQVITVTITGANDAPVAAITPVTYAATEQTNLTLHGTGLAVSDVDIGAGNLTVILSVGEGQITVGAGTTGVTVSNSGTSAVTLVGTTTQINALLAGTSSGTVVYNANTNTPSASTTFTLSVNDGVNSAVTDTATINITAVNDAPVAAITPVTYAATEQTNLTLHGTGLAVSDVDIGAGNLTVILSVGEGQITVGAGTTGVTVSNSGTSAVTLVGTTTQINALLAGTSSGTVVYNANTNTPSASTTFTLSVNDGVNSAVTDTATINITAVNDAPVAAITPVTYAATEQTNLTLHGTGLAVSDVDIGAGNLTVILSVGEGQITVGAGTTGVTVSNSGTSAVTLVGTTTQINALLAGTSSGTVVYNANTNTPSASTTFTLSVNDGVNSAVTDTATINITAVNDAPVAAITPVTYAATEQTNLTLHGTGLAVSDVDIGAGNLTVILSVGEGQITVGAGTTGVTVSNSGTSAVTLVGTTTQINALLAGTSSGTVVYNANTNTPSASTTFTLSVNDGVNSAVTDTATINITAVNDAPVAAITPVTYAATEQTNLTLHGTGLAVSDVDIGAGNLTVILSVGEGQITVGAGTTGVTVSNSGTSAVTLVGTTTQINALLAGTSSGTVVYNANTNTPSASTTFTLSVNDGVNSAVTDTATINITAVNDAPVIVNNGTVSSYSVGSDIPVSVVTTNFQLSDADNTNLQSATITINSTKSDVLNLSNSSLVGTGITAVGDGTKTISLSGSSSVANYEYVIEQILFTSSESNRSGARSITVVVNDGLLSATNTNSLNVVNPIAIDLNRDGIEYLNKDAGVQFDYEGDGEKVSTAWVASEDGLLANQRADGSHNIVYSTQAGETDLQGLAKVYDTNQDKVFDAKDAGFNEFGVWQDADSDGVVDAGEFISLVDRGILSLSLTSDGVIRTAADGDVLIYGQTTFTMTDGSTGIAEDVGFAVSDIAPADGNGVQDIYQVSSVAESSLAIDNFNVDEGDYVDLSAILNPAASVQSLISIDPDGSSGSHSTITVNIGGVEYEVATLYGKEIGVADALGAHPNAASLTDSLNGASWTDVVDVSSEFGGPASISATGGALTNSYSNEAGDWTVQIKSGTATVDANNKQITFSSDQADNQAVITTADGTSHEITNVDRIMWH